jgi:hypothetical protein
VAGAENSANVDILDSIFDYRAKKHFSMLQFEEQQTNGPCRPKHRSDDGPHSQGAIDTALFELRDDKKERLRRMA